MKRKQEDCIRNDLASKMVFLSGPRQVGKTVLSKNIGKSLPGMEYLNYDSTSDSRIISGQEWNRKTSLVVFDELHKMPKWKLFLKGIYDTEGIQPHILVTGSARMTIYQRSSDSLAGRYFLHRLHPLSVAELKDVMDTKEALDALLVLGGFPEPFLSGSEQTAKRWRKNYIDRVLKEDIRDITDVKHINQLLLLVQVLRERVGAPLSYTSLAEDIQVSPVTIKAWIEILEALFIVFRIYPYHKNIARAVKREPKLYFYDSGMVKGSKGLVLENIAATSLLKQGQYLEDTEGIDFHLCYIRDKEKREVDFVTVNDGTLQELIEVKLADSNVSKNLVYYSSRLGNVKATQIVHDLKRERTVDKIQIAHAHRYLGMFAI